MRILRIPFLILLLCLTCTAVCFAERPSISSERQSFDFGTMTYRLDGKVTVTFKERVITADHAQVSLLTMEVWAQDHIKLVQQDLTFTGDALHVKGSESTAHITGHADFERKGLSIKSDTADFNWDTKMATFTDHVTLTEQGKTTKCARIDYNVITNERVIVEAIEAADAA